MKNYYKSYEQICEELIHGGVTNKIDVTETAYSKVYCIKHLAEASMIRSKGIWMEFATASWQFNEMQPFCQ